MQVKKQQLQPDMEKWTGSKLGKEYVKAVYCHPAYLTYMQSECKMPGWMKVQQESRLPWEISTTSDMQMILLYWQKVKRTKEPLKVKRVEWKSCLKLNNQKTKIKASSPTTLWQIDEENVRTVTDFIFTHSKITVDGDCSHKIKRCLLLWRKSMTNLDSVLKSRDNTLPTKAHTVKAMSFPVVMCKCESWTIKKAKH